MGGKKVEIHVFGFSLVISDTVRTVASSIHGFSAISSPKFGH
jgi:uncharacterized membrane protein